MSIVDALKLKNHTAIVNGIEFTFRRPSALDLLQAVEVAKENVNRFPMWLVYNHLLDGNEKAFKSVEEVLECDGNLVIQLSEIVDKLYLEGSK